MNIHISTLQQGAYSRLRQIKPRFSYTWVLVMFFVFDLSNAQEIHTQANAASVNNEADATIGWAGNVIVTSDASEFYSGSYGLKIATDRDGWRRALYTVPTTAGQEYNISIYAKSSSNSSPGIYWEGWTDNSNSLNIDNNWTEYTATKIANGTSAIIYIYTGTPAIAGDAVYIDNVSIIPIDTQAPVAPTLSSTGQTDTIVDLAWNGATDNVGVTDYKVYRDNTLIATLGNVNTYQMTGLTAATTYSFAVRALDAAGNQSLASNLSVTTDASSGGGDTQDPTAPTNLSSTAHTDTTVNLAWNAATDNVAVTGYKIFKDGNLEATLNNVTTYQVSGLTASTTYNFTVSALDAADNESPVSSSVSVTTNASSGSGGSGSSVWSESNSVASYNGDIAVGTTTVPTGYKMAVDGKLITEEVKVQLSGNWPDYVFKEGYDLPTLEEIQRYIEENGHLPDIPSAKEVDANGFELGEMNKLLLEKIEQMMLHMIEQKNQIESLQKQIIEMQKIKNN